MKRNVISVLLFICMTVMLVGCGKDKNAGADSSVQDAENARSDAEVKETEESADDENEDGFLREAKAFDTDIVQDMFSDEGVLKYNYEGEEYSFDYEYHIPEITEDTDGAREINSLIHEKFDPCIEELEASKTQNEDYAAEPSWHSISYETCWNDEILNILIESYSMYSEYTTYDTYNYNAATGEMLTNADLLSMHGIPEDDFLTLAKITAVRECDDVFKDLFAMGTADEYSEDDFYSGEIYVSYIESRKMMLTSDFLNQEIPLLLNKDGDLCAILAIGVPAGAGFYYDILPLERDPSKWDKAKCVDIPKKFQGPEFNKRVLGFYGDGIEGFSSYDENKETSGYFGFDSYDPSVFVFQYWDGNEDYSYTGDLNIIGNDVDGLIFEYKLTTLEGYPIPGNAPLHKGTFYINRYGYYDYDDDFVERITYKWIDGDDLFDTGGGEIELSVSYG